MSYSGYGDYGDEPRRPSRRATREPAGPAKIESGTAAAILVFVAIVGFGIGALIGSSGGDDTPTTTTEDADGAPLSSPDDQDPNSDGTSSEEPTDGSTDDAEGDDGEQAGGNGITLTSPQDGGEVATKGTIDIQAVLDSGEEGVTLRPERSLDGGQTWEPFCEENCPAETSGTGTYTTNFWTGQTGENLFRVVGPNGLASNPITVNIVDSEDEDSD